MSQLVSLTADGNWSPMPHANRNDDSFHDLPPLERIGSTQVIRDPRVSPAAHRGLGAYTGTTMAVCSYGDPHYPGLVAFDYETGHVLWTSAMHDLPGARHRRIAGVLLARLGNGHSLPQGVVFAANQLEVLSYDYSGNVIWRTRTPDIADLLADRLGAVTSLSFREDGYLILSTSKGWVLLVSAVDGTVVDAVRMDVEVVAGGRRHRGTLVNFKSSVVLDNELYLMTKFQPAHPGSAGELEQAVFLARLPTSSAPDRRTTTERSPLRRPDVRFGSLEWVRVGLTRLRGGSPSAWRSPEGAVIFVNSDQLVDGQLVPSVTAVLADRSGLRIGWRVLLPAAPGDAIRGAPAFHAASQTLVAPALGTMFVLRRPEVAELSGQPPTVDAIPAHRLLKDPPAGARVTITSPGALTYDADRDRIVMCNGFRVFLPGESLPYSFLAAYALTGRTATEPEPLWRHPLAATPAGVPVPGPGTYGQPAMFGLKGLNGRQRTGVIINTVRTGTHIIRS